MNDWKRELDEKLAAKEEAQYRAALEQGRKKRETEERQAKARDAALAAKLARFKCHVCGKSASKPGLTCSGGGSGTQEGYSYSQNWDFPGDLERCNNCRKWTCEEHIHKGICKSCAERL
jgi:hypothetical protein